MPKHRTSAARPDYLRVEEEWAPVDRRCDTCSWLLKVSARAGVSWRCLRSAPQQGDAVDEARLAPTLPYRACGEYQRGRELDDARQAYKGHAKIRRRMLEVLRTGSRQEYRQLMVLDTLFQHQAFHPVAWADVHEEDTLWVGDAADLFPATVASLWPDSPLGQKRSAVRRRGAVLLACAAGAGGLEFLGDRPDLSARHASLGVSAPEIEIIDGVAYARAPSVRGFSIAPRVLAKLDALEHLK